MPLTPFMGVSVIVHVLVIVVYGLRNRIAPQFEARATKRYCLTTSYIMSACIILFIFGTVLTGGYMLVTSSITNEHSSVKIASTYLEAVDIGHTKDVSILWIEGATKRACEHVRYVQIESAAQYTYEHIEYIRQQALPDFLKDIAKTAKIWLGSSD